MMKKAWVLVLCLVTAIFLTACQIHIDTDPWPASPGYSDTDVTQTPSSAEPMLTPEPVTEAPTTTPVVTATPSIDDADVEPGFNG